MYLNTKSMFVKLYYSNLFILAERVKLVSSLNDARLHFWYVIVFRYTQVDPHSL